MSGRFVVEQLKHSHGRSGFTCGNDQIDTYFCKTVSQDVKRRYAVCFVAREHETGLVAGFYTLSSNSVLLKDIPETLSRRLPRYPTVPAALIGWLGCDKRFQGLGLGSALLFDAVQRIATSPVGAHAIFVDAINSQAVEFYSRFGFIPLENQPDRLFLPVATALKSINGS